VNYTSARLTPVQPSASVEVSQAARALKAKGIEIIDLGLGEPDFDTPRHIIDAAHEAALAGQTRYTPMAGTAALKLAVSKAYAMTGWRIGYAAGPAELIAGMTKVQSQVSSAPCSIAQAAATVALNGPQEDVEIFRRAYEARRDLIVDSVAEIPSLKLAPPGGAFYAFIDCAAFIGSSSPGGKTITTDVDVAEVLLHEAHVAEVPGSAYGMSPYFRISTASSETLLASAMERISIFLSKFSKS